MNSVTSFPESPRPGLVQALCGSLSRNELFAALLVLGCVNGLVARGVGAVHRLGWSDAILSSFDVSAITLVACAAGLWLVTHGERAVVATADMAVGAVALALIVVPLGGTSWLAVTGLTLHLLRQRDADPLLRRGATILLAVTVPMLWSSLLFQYFANVILEIDASLVASLLGTARTGNVVRFVSGEGNLVVFPACSSLANMSLAFVSWVMISEWVGHRRSPADLLWILLASGSVIAINVARLSLMATSLRLFEAVHSALGNATTGTVILAAIVGWSLLGVRRDLVRTA